MQKNEKAYIKIFGVHLVAYYNYYHQEKMVDIHRVCAGDSDIDIYELLHHTVLIEVREQIKEMEQSNRENKGE
jgi:hypothetical protein